MGKHNQLGANFLFNKSNTSFDTQSKTNSGLSLCLTKSGILHLKKNQQPKSSFYIDNGKIKRDISIETDVCILRGYYKNKFNRRKHSINTSNVGTIEEFDRAQNDHGDKIPEEIFDKTHLHIDVTSLVIKNLNDLLNNWVRKFLLNNNETRQKIDTVLDSILHKLELPRETSSCTYTLDIKVDEKLRIHSFSAKCKDKNSPCIKQSCQTVPVPGKHIRLISTLSIPTNMNRQIADDKSKPLQQATPKIGYNNVFLSVSRSNIFLMDSSHLNMLNISTKSFTKRCATYEDDEIKSMENIHKTTLVPKSFCSENILNAKYDHQVNLEVEDNYFSNKLEIEPMKSLVKSIYADDPANITSTENNLNKCINENYTMTDSDFLISSTHCGKLKWETPKITSKEHTASNTSTKKKESKTETKSNKSKEAKLLTNSKSKSCTMNRTHLKKNAHSYNCLPKKIKHFNNIHKKSSAYHKKHKLLQDLHKILYYIAPYIDTENIKFDIQLNMVLGLDKKQNKSSDYESKILNNSNKNATTTYNIISKQTVSDDQAESITKDKQSCDADLSPKSDPNFKAPLDTVVNQSKCELSKKCSSEKTDSVIKEDNKVIKLCNISPEICKDINELKVIIKNLAVTTENFVKEHLEYMKRHQNYPSIVTKKNDSKNKTTLFHQIRNEDYLKSSTYTKTVQSSNDKIKTQMLSGFHLKKDPKKNDMQEVNTNLAKKSLSYNIIESESILKVTDMTSAADDINIKSFIDKSLNCSLPKSKSQFNVTVGQNNQKLLAYYCNDLTNPRQFVQGRNNVSCSSDVCNFKTCPHIENNCRQEANAKTSKRDKEHCHNEHTCCRPNQQHPAPNDSCEICDLGYSCSSVYIDVEDRSKKFCVRSRSGVGFREGLIYCILLWIPVVVILWLIYVYVIKDIIQPDNAPIGKVVLRLPNHRNKSFFHISVSDLGF